MKVEETGHFQRFVPRTIGTVRFAESGRFTNASANETRAGSDGFAPDDVACDAVISRPASRQ
jgi:hypothetical protein